MIMMDFSSPPPSSVRTNPLSSNQERKLVEYLDDQFMQITRNYKKRSHPTSTLPTLSAYLEATHTLLSLILQIPPIQQQQATLRTALLLRFSSETLAAVPNYPASIDVLDELLLWLDELDRGWLAVLKNQAWDPSLKEGLDAQVDIGESGDSMDMDIPLSRGAVSQTDRARLRSILVSTTSALEEWLDTGGVDRTSATEDVEQHEMDHMNIDQAFNDLFARTLGEMGELHGEILGLEQEIEIV